MSSERPIDPLPGNAMRLRDIPLGTLVHNIELKPGKGGQIVRSAGGSAQLMAKEGKYATLRLPSSEMRRILLTCMASVGQLGNEQHENVVLGKAGRSRWLGIRPSVRGAAMNPVDHQNGGGEGRAKGGKPPQAPRGARWLGVCVPASNKTDRQVHRCHQA